jgi:hypothetical protein
MLWLVGVAKYSFRALRHSTIEMESGWNPCWMAGAASRHQKLADPCPTSKVTPLLRAFHNMGTLQTSYRLSPLAPSTCSLSSFDSLSGRNPGSEGVVEAMAGRESR